MNAVLLSAHVLAAILFVGPVTVAASLFPRQARRVLAEPAAPGPALGGLRTLYRITRVYALAALAVPVLGIATAAGLRALGDAWVSASMAITLAAGLLLALRVLPDQRRVLAALDDAGPAGPVPADYVGPAGPVPADDPLPAGPGPARAGAATGTVRATLPLSRLAMTTGVFNLCWAVVVVLMIVRPGSTNGLH